MEPQTPEPAEDLRLTRLFAENRGLVYLAAKKCSAGDDFEELLQAGSIGLLLAIRRYDCRSPVRFSTYAVPLILGEIRRCKRENRPVKLRQDAAARCRLLRRAEETLTGRLGRRPSVGELAEETGVPRAEIGFLLQAGERPRSLAEPAGEGEELGDRLTGKESAEHLFENLALREALGRLAEREQLVLRCRFFREEPQRAVAVRLGVSQMQVSRIERAALLHLRAMLSADEEG